MTALPRPSQGYVWRVRSECDLMVQQLRAVDAWCAVSQAWSFERGAERDRRLSLVEARQVHVSRRVRAAIEARADLALRVEPRPLATITRPRAVVAHRDEGFVQRITAALRAYDVDVLAHVDDGAEAIGVTIAEQPDLLLVGEALAQVRGAEVLRAVRPFASQTILAAQVQDSDGVAALLDAGATATFVRRVPPGDVSEGLVGLIRSMDSAFG